jgi:hypothetical protein
MESTKIEKILEMEDEKNIVETIKNDEIEKDDIFSNLLPTQIRSKQFWNQFFTPKVKTKYLSRINYFVHYYFIFFYIIFYIESLL